MEITDLNAVIEDFASLLPLAAAGDGLAAPTPCAGWAVRDLLRHVIVENSIFAGMVSGRPLPPAAAGLPPGKTPDPEHSERIYRDSARRMANAFAAVSDPGLLRRAPGVAYERAARDLLEMQITDTLIHTWDLARALGADYTPRPAIARRVLARMRAVPESSRGPGRPFAAAVEAPDADGPRPAFDELLLLSGRDPAWPPPGDPAALPGLSQEERRHSRYLPHRTGGPS